MDSGAITELCANAPSDQDWDALASTLDANNGFATPSWVQAWGKYFLPYQSWSPPLQYLTVRTGNGELQAVFPFAIQRQLGISIASLGGFYWPYRSPIIPDASRIDVLEALASAFTRVCPTLALRYGPVPERHPGIPGLNAALKRQGWRLHHVQLGRTYSVVLPRTWQEFEVKLGKNLRTNAYYYERKMQREGALEIRRITGLTPNTPWPMAIQDLSAVEERSWQRRAGGIPRFYGKNNQGFWTSLLTESNFGNMVSIWLMYFQGEPVSFCFCIDTGDMRHILANCYVEHVKGYSTGSILYRYVFREALESRVIRSINIGLGDSGYKSRWRAQPSFALIDWIAFRPGIRGYLLNIARQIYSRPMAAEDVGEAFSQQRI
jgi:hypothetical protein